MKNKIIVIVVVLVVGFLAGFVPQYTKVSQSAQENQDLRNQLDACKRAEAVGSFRNRAALLYIESVRNNFTVASEQASKDFTDLREFANRTSDSTLKQGLEDALGSRDAIIGGLAKADPAVTAQIQDFFLKLQKVQP